jgi:hypothetical protein
MSIADPNHDEFDRALGLALRRHSEPVSADFTDMMLTRVRRAEEQRILARIVLQQKLALAGCIALAGIAVLVPLALGQSAAAAVRSIAARVTEQGGAFADGIPQAINAFGGDWQFYTILGAISILAFYSLVELLVGHKLEIA